MKPLSIFRLLNSKVVLGIMLLFTVSFANAATITSKATGNWSSAATWTPISRTGTISVTSGTKAVTGVGTLFSSQLAVGSILYQSNGTTVIGTVASITDDTHLTLVANATSTLASQIYTAAVVPTASDDVIIASGNTVTVDVNAFAQSVNVSGNLNPDDAVQLTVSEDFTVNSVGSFTMPGGSALATLVVYGNFLNNGTTDFWKSNVVIVGNLTTTSSSLQNQGNVVVGGDIIGDFNLTGGTGTNQIYAVNPNATVTITPTSIDNNVPPGTFPTGESAALQSLVNTAIYGGTCSFTVNNIANVTACTGSNIVFTVTTSGTAPSPTYQWQVNKNDGTGWSNLTNVSPYSTVTASSLTITNVTSGMNNYQYRAKITASSCTINGNSGRLSTLSVVGNWIGSTSTDWNTASNWCGGVVPTSTTDLILNSGLTYMPSIGATATCQNLTINSGTTLTITASTLTVTGTLTINSGGTLTVTSPGALSVKGAVINNGTLSGSGITTLNGTSAQNISGTGYLGNLTLNNSAGSTAISAVTVSGILTLTLGQFTSNGNLTVDLNTGAIGGSGTGTISGTITTTKNISSNKYHMISCPLSGLTANDWNDDVRIQSGTYANLYSYDETNTDTSKSLGWTAQTSLAAPLTSLKGFALYFTGATTMDETGSYTHSASYSTSTLTNTVSTVGASHNAGADGWNLVGNPYPSALDWSSASGWTKTGLDNAIYCWDPINSRYTSYVAGIGTNGGTQYIPSMQGFWIKVTNPGSGTLAMNNNVRVTSTNPSTLRTAALSDILKLTASSGAYRDETIIRFREDALSMFDSELDAYKMDNEDYTPTLYTEGANDQYSVNSLPYPSKDTSISVKLRAAFNGSYTFNADGIASFSSRDSIIFEDRLLGVQQDLRSNPAYTCSLIQGDTSSRFYIRFRKGNELIPLPTVPPSIVVRGLEDQIEVKFLNETSNRATISVYNTLGEQVFKIENADISSKEYSIKSSHMSNGIFIIKIITDSQSSSRKVYLF